MWCDGTTEDKKDRLNDSADIEKRDRKQNKENNKNEL